MINYLLLAPSQGHTFNSVALVLIFYMLYIYCFYEIYFFVLQDMYHCFFTIFPFIYIFCSLCFVVAATFWWCFLHFMKHVLIVMSPYFHFFSLSITITNHIFLVNVFSIFYISQFFISGFSNILLHWIIRLLFILIYKFIYLFICCYDDLCCFHSSLFLA